MTIAHPAQSRVASPVSTPIVSGTVRVADVVVVVLSAIFAFELYMPDGLGAIAERHYLVIAVGALLQIIIFHVSGLHRFEHLRHFPRQFGRLLFAWASVILILAVAAFLTKTSIQFSRGWILIWFVAGFATLFSCRLLAFFLILHWVKAGRLKRLVAVVGGGKHGDRLIQYLGGLRDSDIELLGVFDDRSDRVADIIRGHRKMGNIDDLVSLVRRTHVDQILVALPWSAEERIVEILEKLRELPVDTRLSPDLVGFGLTHCSFSRIGGIPLLNVFDKPLSGWNFVYKSFEDRVLALALLLFVAPLLLGIAALIKFDSPGPVFFRQNRFGFNNNLIEVYKFRTMYQDKADPMANSLTTKDDSRVTRVGAFLRRSSLDELPQLFNVLKGDMSVVGPRPHALGAKADGRLYGEVVNEYAARHRVKPGITGWAQVNGWRGETDTEEKILKRVEHDLHYIENWSLMLDMEILAKTVWAVVRGQAAY